MNHFSQLLIVHSVSGVKTELHTAVPLLPGPSPLAISKLKKYRMPGSDQIPAELLQAGGEILLSAIHKLINYILKGNCLSVEGVYYCTNL
jgi:hypothetical protein